MLVFFYRRNIKKILNSYSELVQREISLEYNNTEVQLKFEYKNLYHLLGLQYIKDNQIVKNTSANKLKSNITKNLISYESIKKSKQFSKIQDRLEHTYYLNDFRLIKKIEYESYKALNPGTKLVFNFLTVGSSIKYNNKNIVVGFRKDKEDDYYIPVSFFTKSKITMESIDTLKVLCMKKNKSI